MSFEFEQEDINDKAFIIRAKNGGKIAAEALYYEDGGEPGVYGARVDVKSKFRGFGLATALLGVGDLVVRAIGGLRRFRDINDYSYRNYTDHISDEQIIEYDEDGLLFKP